MFGFLAMLNELGMISDGKETRKGAEGVYGLALRMVYVAQNKAEKMHVEYAILEGMGGSLLSPSVI